MQFSSKQSGFTLIEMIVSLAVFSVVVTIAVGALLILISANRQLQDEQSILSNLSFALDSMSREIRTGSSYYCVWSALPNLNQGLGASTYDQDTIGATGRDCFSGNAAGHPQQGVSFIEGGDSITGISSSRIMYYHLNADGKIYRRVGSGVPESIVSDGVYIHEASFAVTGAHPLINSATPANADDHQSSVTIYIAASVSSDPTEKIHHIQTTVAQRTLDI